MSIKNERYNIGVSILEEMQENGDLPLPNIFRLTKVMMEYYRAEGYSDELKEKGLTWKPSRDYWKHHLDEIRRILRDEKKKYFEYYRIDSSVKGEWRFCNKQEYESLLAKEYTGIGTRTNTYNERLDDGNAKWEIDLPSIREVPKLTA